MPLPKSTGMESSMVIWAWVWDSDDLGTFIQCGLFFDHWKLREMQKRSFFCAYLQHHHQFQVRGLLQFPEILSEMLGRVEIDEFLSQG